jgi:hypothetical protein
MNLCRLETEQRPGHGKLMKGLCCQLWWNFISVFMDILRMEPEK